VKIPAAFNYIKSNLMKKKAEKKLHLGKIKIASLNQTKQRPHIPFSAAVCQENISMTAPICSIDSCRF
jgi:hypothetical protein